MPVNGNTDFHSACLMLLIAARLCVISDLGVRAATAAMAVRSPSEAGGTEHVTATPAAATTSTSGS